MIRQETLTSKQDDLTRCLSSRDLKLKELYRATVTFLNVSKGHNQGPEDTKSRHDGEASFLEANKISEGRFFDPATLPSLTGSTFSYGITYLKSRSSNSLRTSTSSNKDADGTEHESYDNWLRREKTISQPVDHLNGLNSINNIPSADSLLDSSTDGNATTGEAAGQNGGKGLPLIEPEPPLVDAKGASKGSLVEKPRIVGNSLLAGPQETKESYRFSELARPKAIMSPSEIRPLAANDSGFMPVSATADLPSQETSSSSQKVPSTSKGDQDSGSNPDNFLGQDSGKASDVEGLQLKIPDGLNEHLAKTTISAITRSYPASRENTLDEGQTNRRLDSETSGYVKPLARDLAECDSHGIKNVTSVLRSQQGNTTLDSACKGPPSTPDEQLRVEEAQSLQQPKIPSDAINEQGQDKAESYQTETSANVTSKIAHGGSNENDAGVGISNLTSETTMKQQDASSKGFSENNQPLLRPTVALRDRIFSGMAGNASKDLTLSRRPPMRIDTGVLHAPESKSTPVKKSAISSVGHPYTPISSSTPNRQNPSASQTSSPPERMTTRVASGALRHKSVSEILGGTPRTATQIGDKSPLERASNDSHRDDQSIQTPRSASLIASPDTATFKLRLNELRDNQKSKLSTVVFARQQPSNSSRLLESSQPQSAEADDVRYENKDYLQSLFTMQASVPPVSHPLHTLILSAHKTLSTANHYVDFRELQDCRMLERIFQLQSNNRWSLRQLERSVEPERPTSHWDVLISQAKWMRTDFREERKWKIAAAKATADSCANWVRSSVEGRKALQIRAKVLPAAVDARPLLAPTPELISSAEDDSSVITDVDTPPLELSHCTAPAAIFSLAREMFIFGVDKTPVTEKLLLELPLYQPSMELQSAALRISHCAPDSSWKTSLIPISKFTQGKMVSHEQGPPRKRSRYNYYDLDRPKHEYPNAMFPPLESFGGTLEPAQEDVALFNPENKHIRDRIHAGHAFRPPSEHIMPSQSFFESRQSSQWTQGEDDELRKLVREYAYNWSLISSCLSSSSIFSSGAERRTPWECFERWIGLEGLPAEMSKTQYFRAYHSRLQAAQRTHEAQQQALQQQQGSNAPHLPVRRRTTQPYLVDRRKNDKHLRLVDAMRKLAKKRETALHKQQHVAGLAAMRKANEAVQPRAAMYTPQEFSRLKYDRECKMQETAKAFRLQVLQQQKAQKAAQQSGQPPGAHGMPPGRHSSLGVPIGTSPNMGLSVPNTHPQAGPANLVRPTPPLPRIMAESQQNGGLSAPGNPQGVPHAPMQSHPMQSRVPPQMTSNIYHEATRVQQEQQRYLAQQRQQQHPQSTVQPSNSASPNLGNPKLMSQSNSGMIVGLQGQSGSPSINGAPTPTGSSSSPRMTTPSQPQSLSSGVVPTVSHISNQIKTHNPLASPEQITKMTTERLNAFRNQAQVAAMQAAAGTNAAAAAGNTNINNLPHQQQPIMNGVGANTGMINPQQYAQMMRNHQSNQQNRNNVNAINGVRSGSQGATPQAHRSGSAQAGPPPSQSPLPVQAQMAGGQ